MLGEGYPDQKTSMSGTEGENSTVQGFGNPVPATVRSEQVGSQSSKSNDHNVSVVENLAIDSDNTTSTIGGHTSKGMLINPFVKSNVIQRSPTRIRKLSRSPNPRPIPRDRERTWPSTSSTSDTGDSDALNRLGKKIDALCDYVKPRSNVHHEIKRLITSIKNLYVEHAQQLNDEKTMETTQAIARMAKQITVCCETQTSPTIANQRNNKEETVLLDGERTTATNSKRRRSKQNSPNDHIQKKGKQRAGETQALEATSLNLNTGIDEPMKPDNVKDPDWQLVGEKKEETT